MGRKRSGLCHMRAAFFDSEHGVNYLADCQPPTARIRENRASVILHRVPNYPLFNE